MHPMISTADTLTRLLACAAAAALLAVPARADVEELGRKAAKEIAAGEHLAAVETLREAVREAALGGPLVFRQFLFTSEAAKGFGLYNPRKDDVFKRGESLLVYVEPVGFGWKPDDDVYSALLTADYEIRTPQGQILAGQREFGRFAFTSRDRNHEVMTPLTLNLSGAKSGDYVLGVTYRDKTTGKSASFDLPFKVK
jgi:hypothetical protein